MICEVLLYGEPGAKSSSFLVLELGYVLVQQDVTYHNGRCTYIIGDPICSVVVLVCVVYSE